MPHLRGVLLVGLLVPGVSLDPLEATVDSLHQVSEIGDIGERGLVLRLGQFRRAPPVQDLDDRLDRRLDVLKGLAAPGEFFREHLAGEVPDELGVFFPADVFGVCGCHGGQYGQRGTSLGDFGQARIELADVLQVSSQGVAYGLDLGFERFNADHRFPVV